MKIFKASVRIYLTQFTIMLISLVMVIGLFSLAQKHPYIFSSITTAMYLISMYSINWNIGRSDSRKIPGYFPDKKVPVKVAIATAVLPIIFLIIRMAAPNIWQINLPFMNGEYDFFITGCKVNGTPDLIYRLWYFPFAAFVPCGKYFAYIAELFILPIIVFVGYNVGLTRFSVFEYLYARVVFSSKSDSKKESKTRR